MIRTEQLGAVNLPPYQTIILPDGVRIKFLAGKTMDSFEENFIVGPMQAIMSGVMTIFFYAIVIAAVYKLFQIATDVSEIKGILAANRANATVPKAAAIAPVAPATLPVLAGPMSLESAEALLREVAAEHPKTTV